jgi:hypothetical protein
MKKPIFLHGLFRSGSTYLFDKFRSDENYCCYYEPFHHVISYLDKDDIDIWSHNGKTSKRMNHPLLSNPHFFEYLNCFESGSIKNFDKSMSYDRFLIDTDSDFGPEKKYIDHLILTSPRESTPVLQFNRSTFRLRHFVDTYPEASHFFLLRNPRSQFQSYVNSGPIFLIINLIIGARLIDKGAVLPIDIATFKDELFSSEVNFYCKLLPQKKLSDHYRLFLYLWGGSLKYAIESGCTIIDMDRINGDELNRLFFEDLGVKLEFNDYRCNQNNEFLLTQREATSAEKAILSELITTPGTPNQSIRSYANFTKEKVIFCLRQRFKYYLLLLRISLVRVVSLAKRLFKKLLIIFKL